MGFAQSSRTNPMFTKRHYAIIAKRLNNEYRRYHMLDMDWALEPIDAVVAQLSAMFEMDNPNFKKWKFEAAVKEGVNET